MDDRIILEALFVQRKRLHDAGVFPLEETRTDCFFAYKGEFKDVPRDCKLQHCCFILEKVLSFLEEGKKEEALYLFGVAQGILWSNGFCTLEELKYHNY